MRIVIILSALIANFITHIAYAEKKLDMQYEVDVSGKLKWKYSDLRLPVEILIKRHGDKAILYRFKTENAKTYHFRTKLPVGQYDLSYHHDESNAYNLSYTKNAEYICSSSDQLFEVKASNQERLFNYDLSFIDYIELLHPSLDKASYTETPLLKWTSVSKAKKYKIRIIQYVRGQQVRPYLELTSITNSLKVVRPFEKNKKYCWSVEAFDENDVLQGLSYSVNFEVK